MIEVRLIKNLRRLEAEAPQAPWYIKKKTINDSAIHSKPIEATGEFDSWVADTYTDGTEEFIVALRNSLSKLLDVIEKQDGALKEYANREECTDCACWIPACTTRAEVKEMLDV